jgi:hypothetical protein
MRREPRGPIGHIGRRHERRTARDIAERDDVAERDRHGLRDGLGPNG